MLVFIFFHYLNFLQILFLCIISGLSSAVIDEMGEKNLDLEDNEHLFGKSNSQYKRTKE